MPRRVYAGYLASLSVLLTSSAVAQEGRPEFQPIPERFGYFQENERLWDSIVAGEMGVSRAHAWRLFAGMNQPLEPGTPNSWPIWFSWPTSAQAFAVGGAHSEAVSSIRVSPQIKEIHKARSAGADIPVNTKGPSYPVPDAVKSMYPTAIKTDGSVKDGAFFVNNGDIMIAVESLSPEGFGQIRDQGLYQASVLEGLWKDGESIDLTDRYVSTKHMYWPVKKDGLTALPWWDNNYSPMYNDYVGYENWGTVVAIDPGGDAVGDWVTVDYLHGVQNHDGSAMETRRATGQAVGLDRFYHHQVTDADWGIFTDADKAILSQASYWLYDEPFEPGDYLVEVAMHIVTKEVPTWTLQSFWWSGRSDEGPYSWDRPEMEAEGPWDQYLLTEANAFDPGPDGELPIAVNPYIEGVIHPIRTNCRNCHVRAGYTPKDAPNKTGYSSPNCPDLLAPLMPNDACFKGVTLSDFAWIIPDRAQ